MSLICYIPTEWVLIYIVHRTHNRCPFLNRRFYEVLRIYSKRGPWARLCRVHRPLKRHVPLSLLCVNIAEHRRMCPEYENVFNEQRRSLHIDIHARTNMRARLVYMFHRQNVQNTQMQTCHYAIQHMTCEYDGQWAVKLTFEWIHYIHYDYSEVISVSSSEYQHLSRVYFNH